MKLTKTLTALTLAIAITPALVLSTSAFADDRSNKRADADKRAGELFMSHKPADALYAGDVIGATIKHRQSGDDVGKIDDLIISTNGRILSAVVKAGGFFGVGGHDVSLGWNHLEHSMKDGESVFYVKIKGKTLKNAPEHKRD